MPTTRSLHHGRWMMTILAAAAMGCGTTDPSGFEVSNVQDNFALQTLAMTRTTRTSRYTWQNSGTRATVNHSTTTSAGTATLVVKDAAGTTVYTKGLVPSLNEPTSVGTAGAWTVELVFSGYSGTVNFRVQKL